MGWQGGETGRWQREYLCDRSFLHLIYFLLFFLRAIVFDVRHGENIAIYNNRSVYGIVCGTIISFSGIKAAYYNGNRVRTFFRLARG